jgi:hypothetical protein
MNEKISSFSTHLMPPFHDYDSPFTHTRGTEQAQTVKHGSCCFADADTDMSVVSCASGPAEELSLK